MGVEYDEFKKFQEKLEFLANKKNLDKFYEDCVKELALRFLREVIKITPVADSIKVNRRIKDDQGEYVRFKKGKNKGKIKTKRVTNHTGGTLRRGWLVKTEKEAEANKKAPTVVDITNFLSSVKVAKRGNKYALRIINPVHYAIYVNYGHRTRSGGFVEGQYFLERAEEYINRNADRYIQKKLDEYLKGALDND